MSAGRRDSIMPYHFRMAVRRSNCCTVPAVNNLERKNHSKRNLRETFVPSPNRVFWWYELEAWWNDQLKPRGVATRDLIADVLSGHLLIEIAHVVVRSVGQDASVDQRETLPRAMAMLQKAGVPMIATIASKDGMLRTVHTPPEDTAGYKVMVDTLSKGCPLAVESLTWSLMVHMDVRRGSTQLSSHDSLSELLRWVRGCTEDYGIEVGHTRASWSHDFRSGLVWCALLHAYDENLLSYEEMSGKDVRAGTRLRCLFKASSHHLGVRAPLIDDPRRIEEEPRLAILYTAQLRNAIQEATSHRYWALRTMVSTGGCQQDSHGHTTSSLPLRRMPPNPELLDLSKAQGSGTLSNDMDGSPRSPRLTV